MKAPLLSALKSYFEIDPYYKNGGQLIQTLYLDDHMKRFYNEKCDGLAERWKLRFRRYLNEYSVTKSICLEMKIKQDLHGFKIREFLDAQLVNDCGDFRDLSRKLSLNNICLKRQLAMGLLEPVVAIQYLRHAYHNKFSSDLRLTIDEKVKCSEASAWFNKNKSWTQIFGESYFIVELKSGSEIPAVMASLFNRYNVENLAISKFALGLEQIFNRQGV